MTLNKIRKNTLIILLCCVVVIGSIGVSDVLHAKWWTPPPWLVSAWNVITGMKDTLEGIDALISAMTLEIEEAEDKIVKIKERKLGHLKRRNVYEKQNLPNEQELTRATNAANDALDAYNDARSEAKTLRDEIAELEAELLRTSPSDERYGSIEFAINLKKSSLADAEHEMKTEKAKYNAEKQAYRNVLYSLSYTTKKNQISRLTYQINRCNREIASLEKKIAKLKQDILDEQERRKQLDADIEAAEDEYEKLKEKAQQPGPQID